MKLDRRTGRDRREAERFTINIDVEFIKPDGTRHTGTISDISETGCFLLCAGDVEPGKSVAVFITLSGGKKVRLPGEVVNATEEIGLALRFHSLGENEKFFIEKLLSKLKEREQSGR